MDEILNNGTDNESELVKNMNVPYTNEVVKYKNKIREGKEPCIGCGATVNLTMHHQDGNPSNNKPVNLRCLCYVCHETEHLERLGKNIVRAKVILGTEHRSFDRTKKVFAWYMTIVTMIAKMMFRMMRWTGMIR